MPRKLRIKEVGTCQVTDFRHKSFTMSCPRLALWYLIKVENSKEVCPGEDIPNMFFLGSHFDYGISRGPFRSSYDLLAAYLEFLVYD